MCLSASERRAKRRDICKEIQKLTRIILEKAESERISAIIKEFRGLGEIAAIKRGSKTPAITSMLDKHGIKQTSAESIAGVFADLYEDLHNSVEDVTWTHGDVLGNGAPPFTLAELKDVLKVLQRGKACDESGIISEMIKDGCDHLWECMLDLFNDVLSPTREPPQTWRKSKPPPSNCRPIAI